MWEIQVPSLGQEDPLEKDMATCSSTLAWKIPWMDEPHRLQSHGGLKKSDTTKGLHFLSFSKQLYFHSQFSETGLNRLKWR